MKPKARTTIRRAVRVVAFLIAFSVVADLTVFRGSGARPPHIENADRLFRAPSGPVEGRGTVLLVNGAFGLGKNHRRYWNNLAILHRTMKSLGAKRIVALDADGTAGVPDRNERSVLGVLSNGKLEDSPLDLDEDGAPDVSGPGTTHALEAALREIGKTLTKGEPLSIFFTDHGQLRRDGARVRAVAMMWNEELHGDELDRMLRSTLPEDTWVAIVAMQCHSAIFLSEVTRPRTFMIASGAPLWIWSDQDYSIFPYHFAAALLEKDPETLAPRKADTNGDGRVSYAEAYRSAKEHDHVPEWPRLFRTEGDGLPALFGE